MTEEKKTPSRIYRVLDRSNNGRTLVRATSQASAVHHVTRERFAADVASQDELVELVAAGVPIQEAGRAA